MATALIDNWSETNCIQLIREFRARPTLWDPMDPLYYKKAMKPQLWEEIGEKLKTPALECKHKMSILMSSFRREKSKIIHNIRDKKGDTSNYVVTWFAFKEMMFLMDKETERKRQQMGADNSDNENEDNESTSSLKRTLLKHQIQAHISSNKRPRFSALLQDVAKQSESNTTASTATTSATPQPSPIANAADTDEEIKSFANFISFKMKKYSETTKNMVQQAICDIIFKADQNFYENTDFVIVDAGDPFAKNSDHENTCKDVKEEYDIEDYIEEHSE